jgi:hypothetical protein
MLLACVYEVKRSEFHQIFKLRADNELKRVMVEKGLGAEEIERILAASSQQEDKKDKPKA